jgi:hypothetical protein
MFHSLVVPGRGLAAFLGLAFDVSYAIWVATLPACARARPRRAWHAAGEHERPLVACWGCSRPQGCLAAWQKAGHHQGH